MGAAFSDIIFAVRGIVAGSGLATTEMRLVMVDIVGTALTVHPVVEQRCSSTTCRRRSTATMTSLSLTSAASPSVLSIG